MLRKWSVDNESISTVSNQQRIGFGYDGNDMNAADSVKQIVRMHVEKDLDYSIELWQRGRQSEYTFHGVVYNWVLQELNSIIRQVK